MKKKDILKEFVSEHREDFDDQEPGLEVLTKIQARLGLDPSVVTPRAKVIKFPYWWAAAALFAVIAGLAVLFLQDKAVEHSIVNKTEPRPMPSIVAAKEDSIATVPSIVAAIPNKGLKKATVQKQKRRIKEEGVNSNADPDQIAASGTLANDLRRMLQSESSSARLAAILASGKSNTVLSSHDLQVLFNTMNNDENSNVRLAALEVLKKQDIRAEVKNLLLAAVAKQDDPVVQMELLASLSPDEATEVKQQLLDITEDPMNIDAVRDQAYAVLLRSNTNF